MTGVKFPRNVSSAGKKKLSKPSSITPSSAGLVKLNPKVSFNIQGQINKLTYITKIQDNMNTYYMALKCSIADIVVHCVMDMLVFNKKTIAQGQGLL